MKCDTVSVEGESAGDPQMSMSSMSVQDLTVTEGDDLAVIATVANGGDAEGVAEVEGIVGSYHMGTETATIQPGSDKQFGFSETYSTVKNNTGTGEKEVSVTLLGGSTWGSQTKSRTVTIGSDGGGGGGEANITVSSITGPSYTPMPGDDVSVEITVENTGDVDGSKTIPVSVNGTEVASINATVSAGGTNTYEATFSVPDTDSVTVTAGSGSTSFNVDTGDSGGGGDGTDESMVDQIVNFAKENKYAVGAGALAVGYFATRGGGQGGYIPTGSYTPPRSQQRRE